MSLDMGGNVEVEVVLGRFSNYSSKSGSDKSDQNDLQKIMC